MQRFTGTYTALCTPFDKEGALNEAMLDRLVEYQVAAGVDGIWLCGGSAEAPLLTTEERKRIAELAVRAVAGRVRIMVHVGTLGTENVIELARHAASLGVDSLSAVPPFFYRTDAAGLHDYYAAIAEATDLPLLAYNVPGLTSVEMTCDVVAGLTDIPTFAGLKYSDYNFFDMTNILELAGGRLTVLSGNDEVFLGALAMGAHGGVGLHYNIVPRAFVRIYRNFREGNIEAARREQYALNAVVRCAFKHGAFGFMKHMLKRKGMDCGLPRRPIRPLSEEETRAVDAETERISILWEDV